MSTAIGTLVSRSSNICGGRMRIDGTRVTVHQIVTCYQQGLTPEEIVEEYPHVNLAQVAFVWLLRSCGPKNLYVGDGYE